MRLALLILVAMMMPAKAERFSIVQMGDLHTAAHTYSNLFVASMDWLLANTNDGTWNVKGVVSVGDVYQSWTTQEPHTTNLTNQFQRLITNGLFVITAPGNHDADGTWASDQWSYAASSGYFWSNIFPVTWYQQQTNYVSGLGYIGTKDADDARQVAMTYTNGIKLLFVSYSATFSNIVDTGGGTAYPTPEQTRAQFLPMTQYVTNTLGQYLDHNGIVLAHFMLGFDRGTYQVRRPQILFDNYDGTGNAYVNIGPGSIAFEQGVGALPNVMMFLSGHTRTLPKGHIVIKADDGHSVDVSCFNLQASAGPAIKYNQANTLNIITFDTLKRSAEFNTFYVTDGTTLTNWHHDFYLASVQPTNWYMHKWTVPFAVPRQTRVFRLQ
jgi:hypothetical protein